MKTYLISALTVLLACGPINMCLSQANNEHKFEVSKFLPTSPEAAMLGRFGDIPVSYYTGTADISIPIYTIKEDGLEIPIALRYHSSGVKVEDHATNVGLGWSLEPQSAIVKIVTGVEDGHDFLITADREGYEFLKSEESLHLTGVHTARHQIGQRVFPCTDSEEEAAGGDSKVTLQHILAGEGQPDIYQYNLPGGLSGKFYINPETGQPVLIDKKAEIKFKAQIGGWIVTTLDGHRFYFNDAETASTSDVTNLTSITFKLTKIVLSNGRQIDFGYKDGYYKWHVYGESYHSMDLFQLLKPTYQFGGKPYYDESQHHTKILEKITAPDVTVDFVLEDRHDLPSRDDNDGDPSNGTKSVKRVKAINITSVSSGRKVKSFSFQYDYFPYSTVGGSYTNLNTGNTQEFLDLMGKRLKLLSVQEIGYDQAGEPVAKPSYRFAYDESTLMPLKTSYARDYWGYYNGIDNKKLLPDLTYFFHRGHYNPQVPLSVLDEVQGANRAPDRKKIAGYILKKVTYPTGGYTTFNYEAHSFSNFDSPDVEKLAEVETSVALKDQNEAYDVTSSGHFTLPRAMTIRFTSWISAGHPDNPATFDQLLLSKILLVKVKGGGNVTILREWKMLDNQEFEQTLINDRKVEWVEDITIPYDPDAYYVVSAHLPDEIGRQNDFNKSASVGVDFSYYHTKPDVEPEVSYGGGVRVAEIRNYNESGEQALHKKLVYADPEKITSGILMSRHSYLQFRTTWFENRFGPPPYTISGGYDHVIYVSSDSYTPFSAAAGGNIVGYSRVEEVNLDTQGNNNGRNVYHYHNSESAAPAGMPEDPPPLNGKIWKEQVFERLSTVPLRETVFTYSNDLYTTFTGVKAQQNIVVNYECDEFTRPARVEDAYTFFFYPINSRWYKLSKKVTTERFGEQTLVSTEDYEYNTLGQLTGTDTYGSRQERLSTRFLYPHDAGSAGEFLTSRGLYNLLLEHTNLTDGVETAKVKLGYKDEEGVTVQSLVERSFGIGGMTTETTFDQYGPHKTLRQFTQKGLPNTILWGYNHSQPVAEVQNASYAEVEAALGGEAAVEALAANAVPSQAQLDALNALRNHLPGAMVTTYTYAPLVGVTSQTDPNGRTSFYEYDPLGRLQAVKDEAGNVLKGYEYNYRK